jgi:hypothetical protein
VSNTQDLILNRKQLQLLFGDTTPKQQAVIAFDKLFRNVSDSAAVITTLQASLDALTAQVNAISSSAPGARQTVTYGPITAAGLPNFLPATSASLVLTTQNISSGTPLVINAAQGGIDTSKKLTTNASWTVLASTTNYLAINASTGALVSLTLAPIYQYGGTPSVTNNQFTFDISQMVGYLGNGAAAVATPLVIVGECIAGASTITSTVNYAYNGYYDSGFTNTLPGINTTITKTSNIGIVPQRVTIIIECITADNGYAVGDQISSGFGGFNGTFATPTPIFATNNTIGFSTSNTVTGFGFGFKGNASSINATAARWKYKMVASRGW